MIDLLIGNTIFYLLSFIIIVLRLKCLFICMFREEGEAKIEDVNAVKPEGWLDDEPHLVPDPEAQKPNDW